MKYLRYQLMFILLLLTTLECVRAQHQESDIGSEKKKIYDFFYNDISWENTKDSTMIIGFSFKIHVKKNTEGKITPISIIPSDTLAYKLFPGYKFLTTINYKLFLKNREEGIFIIPVFLDLVGSQRDDYYTRENLMLFYNKSVFGRSVSKAVQSMLYINKNEENNKSENYIYLTPIMMGMDKYIRY
jgi:hypothetical protein